MASIHRKTIKTDHDDPDNHDNVITLLEPDILECSQVSLGKHHYQQSEWNWWNSNWAISSPQRCCCESAELNMPAHLENSARATGLEKVSFHSNPKGHAKEHSNDHTVALMSHTRKVMLKILQVRLQQLVHHELPNIQARIRKCRQTREIKLPTSVGSSTKQEHSHKTSTSALLTTPKPLTVWITATCGKFLKRWE